MTEWRGFTWSDVVYPGTEVYNRLVMFDFSGVCGSSECVAYNTLSVQDGVLWELSGQESVPRWDVTNSHQPVFVDLANPILVRALKKPDTHESCADHNTKDEMGRADLEIPEVTLSQPHKRGAFFLFHPQLVILLQFLSLAPTIECGYKRIMIVWPA